MIAIVHSIYSQSVHVLALNAGLMDNVAERYCIYQISIYSSIKRIKLLDGRQCRNILIT